MNTILISRKCFLYFLTYLLELGKVYVAGGNSFGQLGLGDSNIRNVFQVANFDQFLQNQKIISISFGWYHTILLTGFFCLIFNPVILIKENGSIYSMGGNQYGQLGLFHYFDSLIPNYMEQLNNEKIIFIACGKTHTIALSSKILF